MRPLPAPRTLLSLALLSALPAGALGSDVLSTTGYSTCLNNPTVKVTALNVTYQKNTRLLTFDVGGISTEVQNVTANLVVSAYGKQFYTKSFNPCEYDMTELCPVPATSFASQGQQVVPEQYASEIPAIAFSIPDLDGDVKMTLTNSETGKDVACIVSSVGNGHTLTTPAISYTAAGIAAAALAMSGVGALAAGGHPGAATHSPSFTEIIGVFQGFALNGMMSVQYPKVYQSFATNFAFSTGLVPWDSMQTAIDNFRKSTGGNLTDDNYQYLQNNATLVTSSDNSTSSKMIRRALDMVTLWSRDQTIHLNGTTSTVGGDTSNSTTDSASSTKQDHFVTGISAYVEELSIPQANTFMTLLLMWAIAVGAIIVLILLLKVLLEAWSMFGNIPHYFESWRKRYWWRIAKALTNLILMLYGVWAMYCIYQWTDGDSWAAKALAAVSFAMFTLILLWFTWRIYSLARKSRQIEGDSSKLYEDKEVWIKYSLFYDSYKKSYWWLFVPAIIYMFARGVIMAAANGHGLVQSGGEIIVEAIFLVVLLWSRPYQEKRGNWINIIIQIVRVASVICVLIFVEELGISQTTKTITGIILIAVQGSLTALLAILIAVNALIACIKVNPHRRARKANEKLNRDLDNLTPLDARNSLLMEPMAQRGPDTAYRGAMASTVPFGDGKGRYDPVPPRPVSPGPGGYGQQSRFRDDDRDHLVSSAASMGHRPDRSLSRSPDRKPTLPNVGYGRAY